MQDYLKGLNTQQLKATTTTSKYVRVVAGAGSGKTRVLTSRIVFLIKEFGVDPKKIMAITFTNKAANEMKQRIERQLDGTSLGAHISTIHSFAVTFLRSEIKRVNYPSNFQILDVNDQKSILTEAYKLYEIDKKDFNVNATLDYIANNKVAGISYEVALERAYSYYYEMLAKIYKYYLERCHQMYGLDFDDLLLFTNRILKENPDVRDKWQNRYEYILVDEFQDIDNVQYEMIELLCNKSTSVFVVGDPDQTIYSWRGANINIILDFEKNFQPTETVYLNQNYRSTQNILNGANSLISYNRKRLEKELFTENVPGEKIVHFTASSDDLEAEFVVRKIFELEKKGAEYNDIAILYRSNYLSRAIEKQLMNFKIPYILYGGVRFYDRAEIKDMLSYLRMLTTQDDLSFKRIINTPKRGIGQKTVDDLFSVARSNRVKLIEAIDLFEGPAKKKLTAFKEMVDDWNKRAEKMNVEEIFQMLFDESDYRVTLESSKDPFDAERLENVKELMNDIVSYKNDNPQAALDDYLNSVTLYSDIQSDKSGRFVSLMTIHAAKGLEFDNVFIIGMSEYVFPSVKTLDEGIMGLEEERRLAYVAYTRAKKRLFLTDNRGYSFTTSMSKETSRFIKEIDEQYIQRTGYSDYMPAIKTEKIKNHDVFFTITKNSRIKARYKPEDIVVHDYFGEGEVISVENNRYVKIAFEYPHMVKTIAVTTPKLRKKGD
ncbi:MAG: ATP-dependent helicase [Erysipelotrichaceae bacterium]|jgi:DNA helicase-2/ATP-dependent DNA helicase PcrA